MKEKTKKDLKEIFELLAYVAVSSTLVFQVNSCNRRKTAAAHDTENAKTETVVAKKDTIAQNARISILQKAETKAR